MSNDYSTAFDLVPEKTFSSHEEKPPIPSSSRPGLDKPTMQHPAPSEVKSSTCKITILVVWAVAVTIILAGNVTMTIRLLNTTQKMEQEIDLRARRAAVKVLRIAFGLQKDTAPKTEAQTADLKSSNETLTDLPPELSLIQGNCKGQKGDQGPNGAPGLSGSPGLKGIQGLKGATGPGIGEKGERGTAGLNGVDGQPGPSGPQGLRGLTGVTGAKGEQGIKGSQGETGAKGSKGDIGIQGTKGMDGVGGLKGETGPIGMKGDTGPIGSPGEPGTPRIDGLKGQKGEGGAGGSKGRPGLMKAEVKSSPDTGPHRLRPGSVRLGGRRVPHLGVEYVEGALEVYVNDRWGYVCDDSYDTATGYVACRDLGGTIKEEKTGYTIGTNLFALDDVRCDGSEDTLLNCTHVKSTQENCTEDEGIYIKCLVN